MKCIGLIVASLTCLCAVAESGEQAAAQGVCGVRYLRWHYTEVEGGPLDGKTELVAENLTYLVTDASLEDIRAAFAGATIR